ncbi:hypothetical protein [Mesorhizobium sp. 1B3]|uniref:hypothetical protein n=1 Tax=Mesorhizobium sp. 1B3 TaxID=3243599 RepID=UPI003D979E74
MIPERPCQQPLSIVSTDVSGFIDINKSVMWTTGHKLRCRHAAWMRSLAARAANDVNPLADCQADVMALIK